MRAKDIEIGKTYAVVGSRSSHTEKSAVPGVVLADEGSGSWRVRFEEPMYLQWGNLKPASQGKPPTYGNMPEPVPVEETAMDSRLLLAPWDDHVAKLAAEEREEQSQAQRLEDEQQIVAPLIEELRSVLEWHGLSLEPPFNAQPQRTWGESPRWCANLTLPPEVLDVVVGLMRGATEARAGEAAGVSAAQMGALGSLLAPMLDD